jgi:hypothetical protein
MGNAPAPIPRRRHSFWVYLTVTVGVVAVLGGWTVATVILSPSSQTGQGQYVHYSGTVPGVVVLGTLYPNVPNPAPGVASTTRTALTTLTMGATAGGHVDRFCAVACTAGHFSEEVEYTITAQAAAEGMQLTVVAQAGANSVAVTNYFHIPATGGGARAATLALYVDLVVASPILSVTAAAQQCTTATTCP